MKNTIPTCLQGFNLAKLKIIGLIAALLLGRPINLPAQSQSLKFERLTTNEGLSHNLVSLILQDHKGFMWFETADGLNKYDGYHFKVYKSAAQDTTSISSNQISALYEDGKGVLWIGTPGGGLNRFDPATEKFTRFVHDARNPHSLGHNIVLAIHEDGLGDLWIRTSRGLDRFKRDTEEFTHFAHDPANPHSISDNAIWPIYKDRSGVIWIGTQHGGLNRFNRDTGQFTRFVHDPKNPHSLSHNLVPTIYEDRSGTLWIGTGDGLNRFDRNTEQFTRFGHDPKNPHSFSDSTVWSIYEDHTGTFWIASIPEPGKASSGLYRFDKDTGKFNRIPYAPENPRGLSSNIIYSVYEDRLGTLWVATEAGLHKFNREKEEFFRFVHDPNNPNSLSHNTVITIYEAPSNSGTLWIATAGGVSKLDQKQEQFFQIAHDPKNSYSLGNNSVHAIYEDRSGALWVGTSQGLSRMHPDDREQKRFTHFVNDPKNSKTLSGNYVSSICEDHAATLWVGTADGGLNRFDREKEQFARLSHDPKNPNSLSDNSVSAIYEDRAGRLWIGLVADAINRFDRDRNQITRFVRTGTVFSIFEDSAGDVWAGTFGGLRKFSRTQETFSSFNHDPQNPHSLSSNSVNVIYEDRTGTLWLGTDGGLNKFDRQKEQFSSYTENDGLPSSMICGILEDSHGRLWLSTAKGISCFNPQKETFRNYDVTDGLQNEFTQGAFCRSRNGEMFFGGKNGINMFHPDSIKDNPYVPPVVITSFKRYNTEDAAGVPIAEKGVTEKKKIVLSYEDNIIAFEFAALSYRNAFKNQYAYKLEGFNENWIQLGSKRDVTFTNLDPGEYTLRVKGSNNDGVWNEEGTSMQILITPPFWKTWWFRTLVALAILGILAFAYNYRVSKLLEIERTRLRIARDLHDDVGSSLSSIALTAEMLQKELATNGLVNRQLARVHETAQRLARNLKEIVWAIDPHRDKFGDLLLHMKEAAEELLGQKGISYTFEVPQDELPQSLKMEFRRNLFLIYKEMLHNVVKHAEASKVEIALTRTNGMLQLQVADNGKGFGEGKNGNGSGLRSMRARAEELNGKLEIESGIQRGTKVRLEVKV